MEESTSTLGPGVRIAELLLAEDVVLLNGSRGGIKWFGSAVACQGVAGLKATG